MSFIENIKKDQKKDSSFTLNSSCIIFLQSTGLRSVKVELIFKSILFVVPLCVRCNTDNVIAQSHFDRDDVIDLRIRP